MDKETTVHVSELVHWVVNNWQFAMLLLGGFFWGAVWAVQKVFPTHKVMRECEATMRGDLVAHERNEIARFNVFKLEQAEEHAAINTRLDTIIKHLLGHNGK